MVDYCRGITDYFRAVIWQDGKPVLMGDDAPPYQMDDQGQEPNMLDVLGPDREVVLARELTKTFETIQGMPLGELIEWVKSDDNQQLAKWYCWYMVIVKPRTIHCQMMPCVH